MKKLRFVSMILVAALLMSMCCVAAFADEDIEVKTTASVNLRKGPGTGYKKITSVKKNREYDYTGVSSYDSRGVVWHRIEYGTGFAWVSSVYSDVVNDGVALNDNTYVETTANVNLRTGPGTGYRKLTAAAKNSKLFYLGEQAKDASGRIWYKVASSEGEAWLTSRYSRIKTAGTSAGTTTQAYVKTTASVNMRKGPGLGYDKVVAFAKGKKLTYLNESSTDSRGVVWYKVKSGSYTGWMSSVYSDLYR